MKQLIFFLLLVCFATTLSASSIELTDKGFIIDGQYTLLRGGTIQWFKLPEDVWEDRIRKFKAAGFNTIDMYVAWNNHEPRQGEYNFDTPDIRKFLDLAAAYDLYVYMRPGPYFTNEYDGGGVPAWVFKNTTKKNKDRDGKYNLRTDDPDYLDIVDQYFTRLGDVIRPYLITNGGPIVMIAVENEYNWFEQFHEVDKLFWYDGGPERGWTQTTGTYNYLSALRDMFVNNNVDVPIATCPGDNRVSAMADVENIVPMPNFIFDIDESERVAYEHITAMHDSNNYSGQYTEYPSGVTETDRKSSRMMRFFFGGLDAYFGFNIAGSHQEGYKNALVLSNTGAKDIFDVRFENINNLLISPVYGFFHNVVDYYGAISPNGIMRQKLYNFRRYNLFLDDFENLIAPVKHAKRSTTASEVSIANAEIGVRENYRMVHYWLETVNGKFLQVLNTSGNPVQLEPDSISGFGKSIPAYTIMTVPVEYYPGRNQDNTGELVYSMVLTMDHTLLDTVTLDYATSEILMSRPFNGEHLLVLHGAASGEGEFLLTGLQDATVEHMDSNVTIQENSAGRFAVSYGYEPFSSIVMNVSGKKLRIIITETEKAGRFWMVNDDNMDYLVTSFDFVEKTASGFNYMMREEMGDIYVLSPAALNMSDVTEVQSWNPVTKTAVYTPSMWVQTGQLPDISTGKVIVDNAEVAPEYNDDDWNSWTGQPEYLEQFDIYGGHAWYRTEFNLSWLPFWKAPLYIESASDIVGIYVNGHYLSTVAPLGTEIDNYSRENDYRFPDLKPYLKRGRNVIAFRTEVWGHGSFMWPRGNLIGTTMKMPALGFDSLKGLHGEAKAAGKTLSSWRLISGLGGERNNYFGENYDDSSWNSASTPMELAGGEIRWFRKEFNTEDVVSEELSAPVSLYLKGRNTKATIYLNGKLIGRWLSDDDWLAHGSWLRPIRNMWMNISPDEFPISEGVLNTSGNNVLAIAFEDASPTNAERAEIDEISLIYSRDEKGQSMDGTINVPVILKKGSVTVSQ